MNIYILYNSKKGTTRKYAEEITRFLKSRNHHVECSSIDDYDTEKLYNCDKLLLGTWTNSTIIIQHPDKKWKQFAQRLPVLQDKETAFFTTCTLVWGTIFIRMKRILKTEPAICLKSRNGHISDTDKKKLSKWLQL